MKNLIMCLVKQSKNNFTSNIITDFIIFLVICFLFHKLLCILRLEKELTAPILVPIIFYGILIIYLRFNQRKTLTEISLHESLIYIHKNTNRSNVLNTIVFNLQSYFFHKSFGIFLDPFIVTKIRGNTVTQNQLHENLRNIIDFIAKQSNINKNTKIELMHRINLLISNELLKHYVKI